ncbi:MAG: hypothetical protein F4W91_03300 [Gemmatimonadetes bacterium]|nr:hypothetical protein [Gemmatimonadota bacterium]
MNIPNNIAPEEDLGRSVFSSRDAKRARRSRVSLNAFLEKEGQTDISVDRLSIAPEEEAVAIADNVGTARNRTFYGWAVVTAEEARRSEREAIASPLKNNLYHADIRLPELTAEDREEQKRHAQELADISRWRERPNLPEDDHQEIEN